MGMGLGVLRTALFGTDRLSPQGSTESIGSPWAKRAAAPARPCVGPVLRADALPPSWRYRRRYNSFADGTRAAGDRLQAGEDFTGY